MAFRGHFRSSLSIPFPFFISFCVFWFFFCFGLICFFCFLIYNTQVSAWKFPTEIEWIHAYICWAAAITCDSDRGNAAFHLQSLQKLNEKNETLPWGKGWQINTGRDRNSMSPILLSLMEKTEFLHCFTEEQIPPDSL